MDSPQPSQACPACQAPADAAAAFCSRCGKPLAPAGSPRAKWHQSVGFILVMIFFVLGPLALPLIVKNPRLSPRMRWVLVGITLLYTVVVIDAGRRMVSSMTAAFNSTLGL
ncbi:MAG: hypothetical protein HYY15_04090 [Candidatus Omnitrophica bacterium]|nr:hypothetical protein [Candidatus Omnitrophota bacterium]